MQPGELDVSAILATVYRAPTEQGDQIGARVRSRLAALETIAECARLLIDAPLFALRETAGELKESPAPAPAPPASGQPG